MLPSSPRRLTDIKAGLANFREVIQERQIDSIAIPPLGCGNGGLEWSDIRPLIVEALGALPGMRHEGDDRPAPTNLRRLADLLGVPLVLLGDRAPVLPVWHVTVWAAPEDPVLGDGDRGAIAASCVSRVFRDGAKAADERRPLLTAGMPSEGKGVRLVGMDVRGALFGR